MNRRQLIKGMGGILLAGIAPACISADLLMPVKSLILPSRQLVTAPDDIRIGFPIKQPQGHMLKLSTSQGSIWVSAELPGAWWGSGTHVEAFRLAYAKKLWSEQALRGARPSVLAAAHSARLASVSAPSPRQAE